MSVESSSRFPSVSSSSSETSVTSPVFPGELPVTVTELLITPDAIAVASIV